MARDEAYRLAEKKTEEARLTGATELDLSGMKLTELPESIKQLTQLQSLNFSANQLTKLTESLGELTQLQELKLSNNQLTELPEWLGQLTLLQSLDISSNQLTALPESLGNLTNLRKLILLNSGFESLPVQICRLRALEILVSGTGQYTEGSTHVFITIGRAALRQLPIELGDLSSLKVLLLGNNQIADIPSSLIQLENLKILNLENNPLNPELAAAHGQGLAAVKAYLRAKATARKLKVFLCYASQDKPIVNELYQKFVAEGWIEPWLDAKKLLPGQDWQAEIKNAVETADNVIIFLSNTSINKDGFIQKELRLAKEIAQEKSEGSVFLIPLRLDDCDVPRSLQIYQWADYFGAEKEQTYSKLLESLKLRLEDIKRKEVYAK